MSLINDALKRAKQAQQQAQTPSPSLQFRPVEPGQKRKGGWDWVVPAIVAVIGIFALVFMWPKNRDASNGPLETKARTLAAAKEPSAAPVAVQAKRPEPVSQPSSPPEPGPSVVPAPSDTSTKPASPPEPLPPPQPPPLRLQAIVFSPTRPSAIINNRTVFIGDRVGDLRVTAITQETTTLSGAGQTNVLTLIP